MNQLEIFDNVLQARAKGYNRDKQHRIVKDIFVEDDLNYRS